MLYNEQKRHRLEYIFTSRKSAVITSFTAFISILFFSFFFVLLVNIFKKSFLKQR